MKQNNECFQLDLKNILFYTLRQWRPIFVIALVMALLLGSIQAYQEYKVSIKAEGTEGFWVEYQQYQDELALYEDRVAVTQSKVDVLQSYVNHSVLMKIDSQSVHVAKATYYIDTDYKIVPEVYQNPDKTETITWHYMNFLREDGIYEDISREMDIEAKYLKELVTIEMIGTNTLALSVRHYDESAAKMIMAVLQEKMNATQTYLSATVAEHTLMLMQDTCGVYVDNALKDNQQLVHDDMMHYQYELLFLQNELNNMQEIGGPDEPNMLAAFVKWCILGCVGGSVLAAGLLFVKAMLINCICAPNDLLANYDIPVLGSVMHSGKKLDCISRWLRRVEGRLEKNAEENMQFLAVNIENHCGGAREILVCGDMNAEESSLLVASLSNYLPEVRFAIAGNLLKEATALKMLAKCDAVLMTVVGDTSRNQDVAKKLSLIQECGKSVLGFVFVD